MRAKVNKEAAIGPHVEVERVARGGRLGAELCCRPATKHIGKAVDPVADIMQL